MDHRNPPPPPLPSPPLAEPAPHDLDARILLAEQRLIARDEDLRQRIATVGERVRAALRPWRLVAPLAGGALALGSLWWMGRRGERHPQPHRSRRRPAGRGALRGAAVVPWVQVAGLAWPLLERWLAQRRAPRAPPR